MPFITNRNSKEQADIFYEDYGKGQPVILIHGWPLSRKSWEQQVWKIVEAGYRCISYDRRGFGLSSSTWTGYDYSTLTSDLNELILQLDLNDAILVGFSMGGGEVVRYFTEYSPSRIKKAALISSIIPLVKQKDDNPSGVPQKDLDGIITALQNDRLGFLKDFSKGFYNFDDLNKEKRISQAQLDYDFIVASHASPQATIESAKAWMHTDFREELKNITVPTLIVHGKADQTVPIETSSNQAAKGIKNSTYVKIDNAPHGLNITHADELNKVLLNFIKS
jgi:non-heme chloroperoxidase